MLSRKGTLGISLYMQDAHQCAIRDMVLGSKRRVAKETRPASEEDH